MTYERSADELEMASHLQEQLNTAGRAEVTKALKSEQPKDFDGNCIDCAEELPPVRIAYGRVRCCECQTEKERLAKLGRK